MGEHGEANGQAYLADIGIYEDFRRVGVVFATLIYRT